MSITLREAKGLPLTHLEMDSNFIFLENKSKNLTGSLLIDECNFYTTPKIYNPLVADTRCLLFELDLSLLLTDLPTSSIAISILAETYGSYEEWGDDLVPSFHYRPLNRVSFSISYVSSGVYNVIIESSYFPSRMSLSHFAGPLQATFHSTTKILSVYALNSNSDTVLNLFDIFKFGIPKIYDGKISFLLPETFEYVAL